MNGDVVRVEERAGLRRLLLNGVVQGAVPVGGREVVSAVDPIVALVRAARPLARTALVIGLGTGRTAASLTASGLDVEVAELSPVIVDCARRFFGYQGHAAVSDGLDYLERTGKTYDVVIVDASTTKAPPERFLREEALAKLGVRRGAATLFATRFQGRPRALQVAVPRHVGKPLALVFSQLFGSGVGDEEQSLYLLVSAAPANLVDLHGIAAWPLFEGLPSYARPTATPLPEPSGSRQVTLIGYLERGQGGELFVDLPHYAMGAMRYQLSGASVAGLAKLVPESEIAPTAGGIVPDEATTKTLRDLLGGGGYQQSEVRFSSVAVAVEGVATLAAVIDPNATGTPLRLQHLTAPTDARLPRGGALYELAVTNVLFTYDRAAWVKERRGRLAPAVGRAARALEARDFPGAAQALREYDAILKQDLAPVAERIEALVDFDLLRARLEREYRARQGSAFALGAGCDLMAYDTASDPFAHVSEDMMKLVGALGRCARQGYRDTRRKPGDANEARAATGRLLALLETDLRGARSRSPLEVRRVQAEIAAIEKSDPGVETLPRPPGP